MTERLKRYDVAGVQVWECPLPHSLSPKARERERMAEEELLHTVFGEALTLSHDDSGKPFLHSINRHISLSHSRSRLCLAVSCSPVGIDTEELNTRLHRVQCKYVDDRLLSLLPEHGSLRELALCWSAKEAVYKLLGAAAGALGENIILHPQGMLTDGVFTADVGERKCRLHVVELNEEYEIVLACQC